MDVDRDRQAEDAINAAHAIDGAVLLDDVRNFVSHFCAFPTAERRRIICGYQY